MRRTGAHFPLLFADPTLHRGAGPATGVNHRRATTHGG